jgi:NitT/TauT family transport system substrate-binding protein
MSIARRIPATALSRRALIGCGLAAGAMLTSGSPARAQARAPVRVGIIPIIGVAPLFVAHGEGWLASDGVDLAVTTFESGPNMIQALASGTIDVYAAGVAPLGVARARGVDVKVVASTAVGENVAVVSPRLARFFAPGVAPAAALAAYRQATGKAARFATQPPGSVPNATLQHWLWEGAKADRRDAEVVAMGIDATQQAVLADAVEGATVREPALTIILNRNPGVKLVASGDDLFPGQPGTVIAVSGTFLQRRPEAVQALVNGVARGAALIGRDPQRAAPHVGAALGRGIVEPGLIAEALTSPASKFVVDPRQIIEPTKAMQRYQVKLGALKEEVPLDALFETRFFARVPTAS